MINLTNVEQYIVGGITQENNAIAGITELNINYIGNTISAVITTGSLVNGNIQPSQKGQRFQLIINTVSGVCTVNGVSVATIGAGALNVLNTTFKTIRNQLETSIVGQSLITGSQVSW